MGRASIAALVLVSAVGVTAALVPLWACSPPGANQPTGRLRTIERNGPARARCLVAFLPGLGDRPEDYLEHGFVERLRAARVDADVRLVDAHFGYYREQKVVERLREDVVEPAEAAGYEQLWLVGISLGGLGSLALTSADPERVDGVILLAPYLGLDGEVSAVMDAGWPEQAEVPLEAPMGPIWRWLATRERSGEPSLLLAYGEADRFRKGHRLASRALPDRDVLVAAGGHRWTVWEELWDAIVASGRLQRACGLAPPAEGEREEQTGDE